MFPWQSLAGTRPRRRRLALPRGGRVQPPAPRSSAPFAPLREFIARIDKKCDKENVCAAEAGEQPTGGASCGEVAPQAPSLQRGSPARSPRPRPAGDEEDARHAPDGRGAAPPPPPARHSAGEQPNAFSLLMSRTRKRAAPGSLTSPSPRLNPLEVLLQRAKAARLGLGASASASASATSGAPRAGNRRCATASRKPDDSRAQPATSPAGSGVGAAQRRHGGPRRDGRCPAVKRVPGTRIIVDGFAYACAQLSDAYVLTHFHSDHYGGLTRGFDCGTILCTPTTGRLAQQRIGVAPHRFLYAEPGDSISFAGCTVHVLDANHCPGAAMFLFRTPTGATVLHTGDFRFTPTMLETPALRPFAEGQRSLDVLMLDTTYCDPRYAFPPQDESIAAVVDAVLSRWGDPATLFAFGTYSIGKERVFMEVARVVDSQVEVPADRLRLYRAYGWAQEDATRLAPASRRAARLRVVPMAWIKEDRLRSLLAQYGTRFRRVVAFRPTGWAHTSGGGAARKTADGVVEVVSVPYSEHSSFDELRSCVRGLAPRRIIPTVGGRSNTARMVMLDRLNA